MAPTDPSVDALSERLRTHPGDLRAYERVEWSRAELEEWLIAQAYEGMLRAMETQDAPGRDVLKGKTAVAELAESSLDRLCRKQSPGKPCQQRPRCPLRPAPSPHRRG